MAITEIPENKPDNPTDLTEVAESTPDNPVDLTEIAQSTPDNPDNLTEVSADTPDNPAAITEIAKSTPDNPDNLTEVSASSPANPTAISTVAKAGICRSLTPLVCLNFANGSYAQAGKTKTFADLFTYSRPSSATFINRRINRLGRYEYFLDTDYVGDVENLVTYSEQFNNADWVAATGGAGVSPVVTANTDISPDGTRTADRVVMDTNGTSGSNRSIIRQSVVLASDGNQSIHLKSRTGTFYRVGLHDGVVSKTVTVTDQWERFEVSIDSAKLWVGLELKGDSTSTFADLLVWGAQLTESAKPLPYVKTLSSAVTETFSESIRRAYDPVTGDALGALIEGGSTNLAVRSEEFDNASWINTRSSEVANDTIAPDGTKSADKLTEDATASNSHFLSQAITFTASDYTFSVFVKGSERSQIALVLNDGTNTVSRGFDLSSGTTITGPFGDPDDFKIVDLGNGWFRCLITNTMIAAAGDIQIRLGDGGSFSYNGDGSSGAYLWGAQVEEHPYATSYIRTEGSTVSRSADDLSLSEAGNHVMTGDMTAYCSANVPDIPSGGADDARFFYQVEGIDSNYSALRISLSGSLFSRHGSSSRTIKADGAFSAGNMDLAFSFDSSSNDITSYFNGENVETGDAGSLFQGDPAGAIRIGKPNASAQWLYGYIKELRFYDVKLTDQEVALL